MKDAQVVLFRRGSFIAVRHEKGWWLAQLYTHVFKESEKVWVISCSHFKNYAASLNTCTNLSITISSPILQNNILLLTQEWLELIFST